METGVAKFVIVKEVFYDGQQLKIGDELSIVHGVVYYNGGMLPPSMQNDFMNFIESERIKGFRHIKPDNPIYNKI